MKVAKNAKGAVLVVALGILLSAGITFAAWSAHWNDTSEWIKDGEVISAQKIAENFEYLHDKVNTVIETGENTLEIVFGASQYSGHAGGWAGSWADIKCPEGSVVTGARVNSGKYVDGFYLICSQIGSGDTAVTSDELRWEAGSWGTCTAPRTACGNNVLGSQSRSATCVNQNGVVYLDSSCSSDNRPSTTQGCYTTGECWSP